MVECVLCSGCLYCLIQVCCSKLSNNHHKTHVCFTLFWICLSHYYYDIVVIIIKIATVTIATTVTNTTYCKNDNCFQVKSDMMSVCCGAFSLKKTSEICWHVYWNLLLGIKTRFNEKFENVSFPCSVVYNRL